MSTLNERQKAFADNYIESLNAEQSAIKAGYSEAYARGNAHKLVANSCIKNYIDERLKAKEDKRIMKQDEILEILTSIARGTEQEEDVTVTQAGKVIRFEKNPSIKDRMKALELLGKRYRMFTDKVEANVKSTTIIFEGEDDLED